MVLSAEDEKTQVQALDRSQPVLPSPARCTSPGTRFVSARTIAKWQALAWIAIRRYVFSRSATLVGRGARERTFCGSK